MSSKLQTFMKDLPVSRASVQYLKNLEKYRFEKPYYLSWDIQLEHESDRSNQQHEQKWIDIFDLRSRKSEVFLEGHGFELLTLPAGFNEEYCQDISNRLRLAEGISMIMRERFRTDVVFCYDLAHRKDQLISAADVLHESSSLPKQYNQSLIVDIPHADHTPEGGRRRIQRHLSDIEASHYLSEEWRVRIINFWIPIKHAVESAPLVFCDYLSTKTEEHATVDVISSTYAGESTYLMHGEQHRWFWFSNQQTDEALIFKNFDSDPGNELPMCFHSACVLEQHMKTAPLNPRESLEMRVIVMTKN